LTAERKGKKKKGEYGTLTVLFAHQRRGGGGLAYCHLIKLGPMVEYGKQAMKKEKKEGERFETRILLSPLRGEHIMFAGKKDPQEGRPFK